MGLATSGTFAGLSLATAAGVEEMKAWRGGYCCCSAADVTD